MLAAAAAAATVAAAAVATVAAAAVATAAAAAGGLMDAELPASVVTAAL